jgi:hypothetical protein
MSASRCTPFWAESPSILWKEASDFFPFTERAQKCTSTALNSFTRFGLYLGVLLAVLFQNGVYLGICIGIAILAVASYYGMSYKGNLREGFVDIVVPSIISPMEGSSDLVGGEAAANQPVADVIGRMDRTLPTSPNPFMNVLLEEIKTNPTRGPAINIDTPEAARELSDQFQTRMYGDPTDVFQHNQNQRTWVVQPSTTIPNDRDSFQNWLFRVPGRTCKEGNNAVCQTGTEGGVVTWLSSP